MVQKVVKDVCRLTSTTSTQIESSQTTIVFLRISSTQRIENCRYTPIFDVVEIDL